MRGRGEAGEGGEGRERGRKETEERQGEAGEAGRDRLPRPNVMSSGHAAAGSDIFPGGES